MPAPQVKEGAMHLTDREWWAVVHGMALGAVFLLAFAGGIADLELAFG